MRTILPALLLAAAATTAARGDVTTEYRIESTTALEDVVETEYIGGTTVVTDNPATRTIVDLKAKTITIARKSSKTYWVRSLEEYERDLKARRAKGTEASPVTLKRTDETTEVQARKVRKYLVEGERVSGFVWFAEDLDVPAGALPWARIMWVTGEKGSGSGLEDALAKLTRPAMWISLTQSGGRESRTVTAKVRKVTVGPPDAELVGVPKDFTKVDAPVAGKEPADAS